jgi:hypothetical protein
MWVGLHEGCQARVHKDHVDCKDNSVSEFFALLVMTCFLIVGNHFLFFFHALKINTRKKYVHQ